MKETYDKKWMEYWWRTLVFQYQNTQEWECLNIPSDYVEDGLKIGKWLMEQEQLFINHKLSALQLSLLKMLRIKWMEEPKGYVKWFHHYEQLKEYYKNNGTLKMSKKTYMDDGTNLFTWKHQQKQLYKKGKLLPYQIQLLEELNMDWETKKQDGSGRHSLRWIDYYKVAKVFYEEYGHLLIKESDVVDGVPLGKWLQKQRERYLGTRNPALSNYDIAKLEDIGMNWKPYPEAKWDYIIQLLAEFIRENKGKQKLSKDTVYKKFELGAEFMPIYRRYKNNELPKEKAQKLRMLGIR